MMLLWETSLRKAKGRQQKIKSWRSSDVRENAMGCHVSLAERQHTRAGILCIRQMSYPTTVVSSCFLLLTLPRSHSLVMDAFTCEDTKRDTDILLDVALARALSRSLPAHARLQALRQHNKAPRPVRCSIQCPTYNAVNEVTPSNVPTVKLVNWLYAKFLIDER